MIGLDTTCGHTHDHLQLRVSGPQGSRTAAAARYPQQLCVAILAAIPAMFSGSPGRDTPQDGGRSKRMPSFSFSDPEGFAGMTKVEQILNRLGQLREVACQNGYADLYEELVEPWVARVKPRASTAAMASCEVSPPAVRTATGSETPSSETPSSSSSTPIAKPMSTGSSTPIAKPMSTGLGGVPPKLHR